MSGAILFHGEDHDIVVAAMHKRACEILGVSSTEELFNHGDYQEVLPTSKSYLYSMETIQSVVKESALPPFRGTKRIVGLLSVDRMLAVHANALLKTLEDAPPNFMLMLTTTRRNDILKTILSRVQEYHASGSGELTDYSDKIVELFLALEKECFETFLKKVEELSKEMMEEVSSAEKKFRSFLESFMLIFLQRYRRSHLQGFHARDLEILASRSITAFHGNIRLKNVIENLFLESQQLHCSS